MSTKILCLAILPLLLAACTSNRTHTYKVSVKNDTKQPLSAALVKGGEMEDNWWGPEHIAMAKRDLMNRHWGTVIQPGQTLLIGPQKGTVDPGITPYLRVYVGDRTVEELLASSSTSPERADAPISPGENMFVVTDEPAGIQAKRIETTGSVPKQ